MDGPIPEAGDNKNTPTLGLPLLQQDLCYFGYGLH